MNALAVVKNAQSAVTLFAGKTKLKVEKHSPEILLGAGILGFVGTVVLASRATLKAEAILDEHQKKMKSIKDAQEIAKEAPDDYEYDESLATMDKAKVYGGTVLEFTKLYAPSVALGAFSVACLLTSRNILNKRYLGAVSAFNAVSEAFETYRKRVREEEGEMMDRHYRYGTKITAVGVEKTDQNGDAIEGEQVEVLPDDLDLPSEQAVIFDESNPNWDPNPEFNMMFLRGQQNMWNDVLRTRGHVFLNEVLEALGFPHTQSGAVLGWIRGMGDDYIDFGLYNINRPGTREFVNGRSNVILLDFNHDGIIWDKIDNP